MITVRLFRAASAVVINDKTLGMLIVWYALTNVPTYYCSAASINRLYAIIARFCGTYILYIILKHVGYYVFLSNQLFMPNTLMG